MYNSISSRLEGVGDLGLGSIVLLYDPRPWARCHIGGETVKPTRVVRALSLVVSPLHRDRDGVLVPDGEVFTNKLTRIKQILWINKSWPGFVHVGVGDLTDGHAAGLEDLEDLLPGGGLGHGGDVQHDPLRHPGRVGLGFLLLRGSVVYWIASLFDLLYGCYSCGKGVQRCTRGESLRLYISTFLLSSRCGGQNISITLLMISRLIQTSTSKCFLKRISRPKFYFFSLLAWHGGEWGLDGWDLARV